MQLNITKQIALVLFVPLLGALAVVGLVYSHLNDSSSDTAFVNVAGRQRMLSEQIHASLKLSLRGGDRQQAGPLKKSVEAFDRSLEVLTRGGSVMGLEIPPATSEILQSLAAVKKHWVIIKPILESIMNEARTLQQARNLYASVEEHGHHLTALSDAVVIAYGKRSGHMRQLLLRKIEIVAVVDLLLLLLGIGVIRRYDRERKASELQLQNEVIKQKALHDIVGISLRSMPLDEQLDAVLDILFELPSLTIQEMGSIFLTDEASRAIKMVAHGGISKAIIETCSHVPFGQCICGRVAETQQCIISSHVDHNHDYKFEGMDDHGHVCMPIMSEDKLRGVMNLYVQEGHSCNPDEERFLITVTDTLAIMIDNQIHNDLLKTQAEIIDNIHDSVVTTDMEGFVTSWNKGAERMFGYEAGEVIGRHITFAYPQDQHEFLQTEIIDELKDRGVHDIEVTMMRKSGELFYGHLSLSMQKDASGKEIAMIGYIMDISVKKRAEQELACRIQQQAAIAKLGRHALTDISLGELLDYAAGLVVGILRVDYSAVLELSPAGDVLQLRAGEGWHKGLVGKVCVDVIENSQAGYTLRTNDSVIVSDLSSESRFKGSKLLIDHGVVSCMSVVIQGHDGPYGIFGVHTRVHRDFDKEDITFMRNAANILAEVVERRRVEGDIIKSEARFRNLVETTTDWIWEVNEHAVYTYASPRIKDILGYLPAEIIGKTPFDLMPPDEAERVAASYKILAKERSSIVAMENINRHKDGHLVILETNGVPIYDENGDFQGYRGIDRDITDRKKNEQDLEQLAHYDYLTGLPNRALFFDRLQQSLARAPWHDRKVAVMFLDLDRFKIINDTLGHDTGDQLLAEVATRLSGIVRDGDTVARLGGDEFAIILDDVAESGDMPRIAQSIHAALEKPVRVKEQELYVTTSIGISCYPDDGDDPKLLVTRADIAMYYAKAQGRNNYQFYSKTMDSMSADHLYMETQLRHALEGEEYLIHYQPKLDLASGHICGMEALVRWMPPDEDLVSPDKFIPLLEDTGLIIPVGEWILNTACRQTRLWQEAGFSDLSVSVNLSARQFKQGGLEEMVMRVLQETGLDPRYLELEITESILMDDTEKTINILESLHDEGIRIVIDDFGTGYSSLSYLKQFPISTLKIDRSFIIGVTDNEEDSTLTQAIIAMAHSLNIRVVAEGVENEEQKAFLRKTHCDEVQGYHYSKPLAAEEMEKFLQDSCHAWQQKELIAM